jgi:hypothetical protein
MSFAFTVKPRTLVGATFLKFLEGSLNSIPEFFFVGFGHIENTIL